MEAKLETEQLRKLFSEISCVLMPDPGKTCIKSSKEANVDDDFQQEMKKMVEEVFTLGNSLVRSTNGTRLTCEDLFKSCVNLVKNAQHNQFHTLCSLHKAQQSIVDKKNRIKAKLKTDKADIIRQTRDCITRLDGLKHSLEKIRDLAQTNHQTRKNQMTVNLAVSLFSAGCVFVNPVAGLVVGAGKLVTSGIQEKDLSKRDSQAKTKDGIYQG